MNSSRKSPKRSWHSSSVSAEPGSAREQELLERLDQAALPRHIAVIMDGNGRWARTRSLPRLVGHKAGVTSVRKIVEACARLYIDDLTLYAFSTENWQRPVEEVNGLMGLLQLYVDKELKTLQKNDIRFRVLGRIEGLPDGVRDRLTLAERETGHCEGMRLNVAVNYSGRTELVDACKSIAQSVKRGDLTPEEIDESAIESRLHTAGSPDPDLLIRTSGERRVSNFLLWQLAYAELYVTDVFWPDFRPVHLYQAILDFQRRERRFGTVLS